MARHTTLLRQLAHELSVDPERLDRPKNAAEAESRFLALVERLQHSAPRSGLGAATARFCDHLAALTHRYGKHLFVCFDDDRIPATTNMLEGFFGRAKRLVRRAAGSGSTTNSVVHNLGPEFLIAFARFEKQTTQVDYASRLDVARFQTARAQLASAEAPASHRRSMVRHFKRHLDNLRARWGLPANTPDTS